MQYPLLTAMLQCRSDGGEPITARAVSEARAATV